LLPSHWVTGAQTLAEGAPREEDINNYVSVRAHAVDTGVKTAGALS